MELWGSSGPDSMTGSASYDTMYGFEGNDTLNGGDEADWLWGGTGVDSLVGGGGNDLLLADSDGGLPDVFDGGEGNDQAFVNLNSRATGVVFTFVTNDQDEATLPDGSVLRSIETLHLSGSNTAADSIVGGHLGDGLGGAGGDDTIDGADGNDSLVGGKGNDRLLGGNGDDLFLDYEGDTGADTVDGGAGHDSWMLEAADSTSAIVFSVAANRLGAVKLADGSSVRNIEQVSIIGSNTAADSLGGGAFVDTLHGGGGNDTLNGGGGADELVGGAGDDRVLAGAGNDSVEISSTDGKDSVNGGAGNDLAQINWIHSTTGFTFWVSANLNGWETQADGSALRNFEQLIVDGSGSAADNIHGGALRDEMHSLGGDDRLFGGGGNDLLDGSHGNDLLLGDKGNDAAFGGNDRDTLQGGDGNDTLDGEAGKDRIDGEAGDDSLDGGSEGDTVDGGAGDDYVYGGIDYANDLVLGGDGNDIVAGNFQGLDTLDGGAGNDAVEISLRMSMQPIVLSVAQLLAGDVLLPSGVLLRGIERLIVEGSNAAGDSLVGGALQDDFYGWGGNDTLRGNGGADSLDGAEGNDLLLGGGGNGTVTGAGDDTTLDGGTGIDLLRLDLHGEQQGVSLAIADVLAGVTLASGATLRNFEHAAVQGSDYAGDDLRGGVLADSLFGGGGDDTLAGGGGEDALTGGWGSDHFVFDTAPSADTAVQIGDFDNYSATDRLVLPQGVFGAVDAAQDGSLAAGQFYSAIGATAAHDADDRIIHDRWTGTLYYDPDGMGGEAAIHFATNLHLDLTAADFLVAP